MTRIHPNRRSFYREKLIAHKLVMKKLNQLTQRLPQPDDAEIQDTIVLDLIEGRLSDIVVEWVEFFGHHEA